MNLLAATSAINWLERLVSKMA